MTTQKRGTRALGAAVITLVACVVFTFTFIRSVAYSPEAEIPLPTSLTSAVSNQVRINDTDRFGAMGLPTRLIIPDLNIDAEVQKVGIAKSGNMTPPSHFSDVGWYKYGTVPGEVGSAVMAGHVDNALGLAGVFKYLGDLNTGQDIYVSTDKGEKLHFKVADIASYDYTNVPTETIFNQADAPRLRLITCGGSWIQSAKSYDKRVVVTALLLK